MRAYPCHLSALSASLLTLLLALPSQAHIEDQYNSIHFNSGMPDFGTLPRRGTLTSGEAAEDDVREAPNLWGMGPWEDAQYDRRRELTPDGSDNRRMAASRRNQSIRAQAQRALERGAWAEARHLYTRLAAVNGWTGDLRDRVAVLDAALEQRPAVGVATPTGIALRHYLAAMDDVNATYAERWSSARTRFVALASGSDGGSDAAFLQPFARYQIASLDAGWFDYPRAIAEYRALLHDAPPFPRREDALIMIARCAILPATEKGRDPGAGRDALKTLLADYPHTRFRASARGLQARLDCLEHRYADALDAYFALGDLRSADVVVHRMPGNTEAASVRLLCAYLRRLDHAATYEQYVEAISDTRQTIAELTPREARLFVARLRGEPALLAPYFYYRLYHCDNNARDLTNLARLASSVATRNGATLPPHVAVRLAEVFYRNRDDRNALLWAQTAMARYAGPTPFDRALYVQGAVWNRTPGRAADARHAFETLLARCPTSPLRFAAHENLAIADEAAGDLAAALDQYFLLRYQPDIAFFLDARMTTAQVAAYTAARPVTVVGRDRHELLVYSLGLRYLRDENWTQARLCLESLPHKRYVTLWKGDDTDRDSDDNDQPDPLRTIADLSHLQQAVQSAVTPNARAHALFRYATYYYDHGTLLLYNDALWKGCRAWGFAFWWNGLHATVEDGQATRRHMYQHEAWARTQAICERIARDYPDSPTAPYALYRAGCCAARLAHFNGWWRDNDIHHGLYRTAARLMRELQQRYPHSELVPEAHKFARVFHDAAMQSSEDWRSNGEDKARVRNEGL